ncbi:gliding motility-associated C-terminal domain-containing protein [Membranicola marinus]|uniref:Gliding motility-associated C-terminal domain-containing protein n=1 Tax=Membranihabitans marinus TaxID=1227546 RepID=A0A953HZ06_9BACT|nr:gliding motility-associated C-terminal domain-containing protein [Membranihabitans marinus]MBY5958307.1 gliding motility-associated C-terminal domain-containing protein [Membranihabitans marinus]
MARSWQRIVVAFGSMILITFTSLNGQGHWNASNCGNYAPTLDRIVTNSCSSYEPDEYFIFHTNNSNLNVSGQQLSIRVNVTNGSFVSDRWTSNPTALQAMNQQSGCGKPLFLDPFAAPYNGTIPAHANVIAFVQRSPDFSGKLSGLCSQKAIFVLFGNYTPGFIKSMFANTCGSKPGCTRHIVMNLGGCSYDIVYEPDRQSNKNGDYIYGSGNSIRYGNASSCHPVFAPPKYTPPPILNRTELMKCENDADIFHNFSVMNGDNFTAWYTNINDPPIHRGPTFRPPASLFPQPVNSQTASRSLFVANEYGGRSGKPVELTLTTYPSPLTASISLLCGGDQTCNFCDGQEVLLELDLDQNTQQGGFPYSNLIIKNNTTEFPITPLQTGINKIVLPPPSSANNTYRTVSVENKYGCISTSGFKVGEQAINIQKSTAYTLPKIPDMCTSSNKFPLPLTVDQVTGSWFIQNRLIKEINPKSLKPGIHFATFKPSKPCHSIDSVPFQISPVPTAEILLSDIDCSKSTYTPQLSRSSSAGGKWSISPKIPIDGVTGSVSMKDFFPGTTYTWSYHVGTECMIIVEAAITARDCVCKISSRSTALSCNDNATPSDSTDDTFTFDLVVTGKNHSGQWIFQDGSFSGTYDTPTPIGPFRISDGTRTIRIRDHDDPTCTTEITIDPPPACSNQCEISAALTQVTCHDNATPSDSTDDTFTFDLVVTGKNHSGQWIFQDGSFSGTYDTPTQIGPFRISDGTRTIRIRDHDDPTCTTEITIDPPPACSNQCEISAALTQVTCHDNGTPSDTTDDNFTFELSMSGQNHSGNWTLQDGSFSGTYDTPTQIGPFSIHNGQQSIRIIDANDQACQADISIDPPPGCSSQCELKFNLRDSCVIDSLGEKYIYYFIQVNPIQPYTTIGIYFQNQLFDIVPGSGEIPIGPFMKGDIGKEIFITHNSHTNCQHTFKITAPLKCKHPCNLKISDISHPICLQASSGTLKARHLSLRVYSNTYPVLLQLNDHTIGKAINSDLNTYTLPTVHRKAVSGTYTLSARESEQCSTEIILNSACLPEDITFPNAFTPNQDGANDLWIARLPDESKIIRATIYDRWGRQIYNADQKTLYSGEIIWNGMDGSVSSGTGVYKFEIIWTHKSKKYIHSGDILLIR